MSLYKRVGEGLTPPQKLGIFRAELTAYRNGMRQEVLRWEDAPEPEELCSTASSLRMLRELWGHISNEGVPHGVIDDRYLRRNLPELEPLERQGLAIVLEKITNFRGGLQLEVASRIAAEGASSTPTTLALATRLVAAARAQAVHEILLGVYVSPFDQPVEQDDSAIAEFTSEPATAAPCGEVAQTSLIVPPDWKNKTAYQIAELMIETNPQLLAHRTNGKRGAAQRANRRSAKFYGRPNCSTNR